MSGFEVAGILNVAPSVVTTLLAIYDAHPMPSTYTYHQWCYLKTWINNNYKPGIVKDVINAFLQPLISPSLPHQPQLEYVHFPPALYALVARVVRYIIELVLLEEVAGIGTVTLLQHTLQSDDHTEEIQKGWWPIWKYSKILLCVYGTLTIKPSMVWAWIAWN